MPSKVMASTLAKIEKLEDPEERLAALYILGLLLSGRRKGSR